MLNLFLELISTFFVFSAIILFPLTKENITLFNKTFHKLFLSNIFFIFANFFTTLYALINGYIPLLIQMIIFSIFSLIGIKNYANKEINIKLPLIIYILLIFTSFIFVDGIHIKITFIEIIAAIFAVIGTFYMNIFKNMKIALILFLVADMLYVLFFISEHVWIYVFQYMIFIIVNGIALKRNYL